MRSAFRPRLSETPSIAAKDTIKNVQALRGIAALLVIWSHVKFPVADLSPAGSHIPLIAAGNGAIGVDLFFAISGFVISMAACKRNYSPVEFLLARIARVSPLYYCFVCLFIVSKWVGTHRLNAFPSVWNGFFYLPLFDLNVMSLPPGGLGWTLCFEMGFYTTFAAILFFLPPRRAGVFLPIIFLIGAPLANLYQGAWYFPRFMFHPFTLDFAAGCLVFQLQRFLTTRVSWLLLGIAFIYLFAFTTNSGSLAYPELAVNGKGFAWTRALLWGLPAAMLLAGMVGLERSKALVCPGWLVWTGTISYSLYLSQGITIFAIIFIGKRIGLHNLTAVVTLTPISCVLVAWFCWRCIETPLTHRAQGVVKQLYGKDRKH